MVHEMALNVFLV